MSSNNPKLESAWRRFEEADIDKDDRAVIEEVLTEMRRRNLSDSNRRRHLYCLSRVARARKGDDDSDAGHGVALKDLLNDEDAVDDLREWVNTLTRKDDGKPVSEWTKHSYRCSLRKVGSVLGPGEGTDVPFPVNKVSGTFQGDIEDTAPKQGDVLFWGAHMVSLIEDGTTNPRDAAYLATGWDGACRPWELRDLTYGQIERRGPWLQITVGGKDTRDRDNILFAATPYLKYWLDVKHPANDTNRGFTAGTPVWTQLEGNAELGKSAFPNIYRRAVKRAGLDDKPTATKTLRKSRASVLAIRAADPDTSYDQWDLENHMGWEHGSPVPGIYIDRFGDLSNVKRGRLDGVPEEHLPDYSDHTIEDPAPVQCPHCEHFTPRHRDSCLWCQREFVLADATEVDLEDSREAVDREEVEMRERRNAFMRDVAEDNANPEKLDVAVRHGDFLAGNEEAADAAKALRDALDGNADD